jgi:hypothetical protein
MSTLGMTFDILSNPLKSTICRSALFQSTKKLLIDKNVDETRQRFRNWRKDKNVTSIEILELEQVCWYRSCKHFWVIKHLVKTLDKAILFKGTIFQGSTKPLFTSKNRVEIN